MNLKGRIRKIEAVVNAPGNCATCSGRGGKSIRVWVQGEPEPPIQKCPECGQQARSLTTILIESDPVAIEQPDTGTYVTVAGRNA